MPRNNIGFAVSAASASIEHGDADEILGAISVAAAIAVAAAGSSS